MSGIALSALNSKEVSYICAPFKKQLNSLTGVRINNNRIFNMEETTLENTTGHVATPHDDFDWNVDKRNVVRYNEADRVKYDAQ